MRTVLHITSFAVFCGLALAIYHEQHTYLIALLCWYVVGLLAAMSHIKWTRKRVDKPVTGIPVFYTWYSLGGVILLITTKFHEAINDMVNIK
jgi:hypothetical protein